MGLQDLGSARGLTISLKGLMLRHLEVYSLKDLFSVRNSAA